jgi:hypothetical protein
MMSMCENNTCEVALCERKPYWTLNIDVLFLEVDRKRGKAVCKSSKHAKKVPKDNLHEGFANC